MAKHSAMGGMFGLDDCGFIRQPVPPFLQEPCLKLINGRSGFHVLIELLRPATTWVPAYLCHSITDAIRRAKGRLSYYPINARLQVGGRDWIRSVRAGDLVVFIDYFGFDLHREAMAEVKARGATVLQDAAQSLLSAFERPHADYVLYSPRKFLGVPDGGILQARGARDFSGVKLADAPPEYLLAAMRAFNERTWFDRTGTGEWYSHYQAAEALSPIGAFRMTSLTAALLQNSFDYARIARRRVANYNRLFSGLPGLALLGKLPAKTVPLGFPIAGSSRLSLCKKLYDVQCFCPVHWPMPADVPDGFREARRLSSEELTLLCDQRCTSTQIDAMIDIVKGERG